ncbi:MAG: hypothetical protein NVV73_12245 [Cellvibrionaceae bacterium]|nr:hypothetical protein [Cellvibrionaceae bacterium]
MPLRVRAFNPTSRFTEVSLQISVVGGTPSSIAINCTTNESPCGSGAQISPQQFTAGPDEDETVKWDLFFDQSYNITVADASPRRSVQIQHNGLAQGEAGYIYINDSYTGFTVADNKTFVLPQSEYRFAVGGFSQQPINLAGFARDGNTVTPVNLEHTAYSGRYFEQTLAVTSDTTVDLTTTPALSVQHELSILVVPVKNTVAYNKDNQFIGNFTLDESYIERFYNMMRAVDQDYVRPFSYGLNRWNVSLHPVVNEPAIRHVDWSVDTGGFLQQANLRRLQDQYDVVMIIYNVEGLPYIYAGALGGYAFVQQPFYTGQKTVADSTGTPILTRNTTLETGERELPHEAAFHELLHIVEQWNAERLFRWNGIDGLHGGEFHGYSPQDAGNPAVVSGWAHYHAEFMQGRVAEPNEMHKAAPPVLPVACGQDCLYAGVFETIRTGLGNLHPLCPLTAFMHCVTNIEASALSTIMPASARPVARHCLHPCTGPWSGWICPMRKFSSVCAKPILQINTLR